MLKVELDKENKIVILEPNGALNKEDFQSVAKIVDPFIEEYGVLHGIIIYTQLFPRWDNFAALVEHLKFIKDHHKKVSSIAFVTDSLIGDLAQHIAPHFVQANIKHFNFSNLKKAQQWIINSQNNIQQHGLSIGINRIDDNFFMTFKAIGTLTHKDYQVITPMIDSALKGVTDPKIKVFVDFEEFEGWEVRAAWDDFKIGLNHGFIFDKIALYANHSTLAQYAIKVSSWFSNIEVKEFESKQKAIDWLNQ